MCYLTPLRKSKFTAPHINNFTPIFCMCLLTILVILGKIVDFLFLRFVAIYSYFSLFLCLIQLLVTPVCV